MSALLDHPITWRSLIRIGLAFAAEYALLALIEDAPVALKVATSVCAIGALATLEAGQWLRARGRFLFSTTLGVVALIYAGFLGYAINHAADRISARRGLEGIYVKSGSFLVRDLPLIDDRGGAKHRDPEAINQFGAEVFQWERDSARWIGAYLGETARDRFLDPSSMADLRWALPYDDAQLNQIFNHLAGLRKNLAIMIESGAYVD